MMLCSRICFKKCVFCNSLFTFAIWNDPWGNVAAKYIDKIRVQPNYVIEIMTDSSFCRTKLAPIYCEVNILKIK